MRYGREKSDRVVVPQKSPNNAARAAAEAMEGRTLAKGNSRERNTPRTQRRNKTRILEFGRYAANNRARRGEAKPETFNFLGFTHICGRTRNGRFTVRRQTMAKRLRAKLGEVKTELRRRMTEPIPEQGKYLRAVLTGHVRYYGVPGNGAALQRFRHQLGWHWGRTLRRRGNRHPPTWERLHRHITRWLPSARVCHPWPSQRLGVITQGRSPVR